VVGFLAAVAAGIGLLGADAMRTYNDKVQEIDRASGRAIFGEQVNGLIYAVVMDSRGIYMSSTTAESEKFAPLLLANLTRIELFLRKAAKLALVTCGSATSFERRRRNISSATLQRV
jgi:methyl-accepting chemotaxis protein